MGVGLEADQVESCHKVKVIVMYLASMVYRVVLHQFLPSWPYIDFAYPCSHCVPMANTQKL